MAIGEKYAPLGNWLKEHGGDSVKLTFDELNQIIPIPNHAYKNRPSWANLSNPASFCSSWISAGYVVDSISLEEQWVVFRKGEVQGHTHHSKPPYRVVDQKKLAEAIQAGYECYDSMLKQSSRFLLPRITASACKKLGIVHSAPMPLFLFLFSTFFNCAVGHSSYFGMIDSARRGRYNKIISVYGKKDKGYPLSLRINPKR